MIKKFEQFVNENYTYDLKKYISELSNDEKILLQKLKPYKDEIGETIAWIMTCLINDDTRLLDDAAFSLHSHSESEYTEVSGDIELGDDKYFITVYAKKNYAFNPKIDDFDFTYYSYGFCAIICKEGENYDFTYNSRS